MKAEIITIGDELLIGQVIDTNSAWLGQQLGLLGVAVRLRTAIADDHAQIVVTLQTALERSDLVIVTGGLGPTKDDITKKALCDVFSCGTVQNHEVLAHVTALFKRFGREVSEVNRQQAELPTACQPLHNAKGTAPGMWFERNGHVLISLPGVPYEMKCIMTDGGFGRIANHFATPTIQHRTVLTIGMGESWIAERISAWEDALPIGFKLAYLPSPGRVRLRLSASGNDQISLSNQMDAEVVKLCAILPDVTFGFDDETLEWTVGRLLLASDRSMSTAESCTGGMISQLITSVSGSSVYFVGGAVVYSYEMKQQVLGVRAETLIQHGAVSEQTVVEMAQGSCRVTGSDYSVAVSGIAGPGGGTDDKPVGTVWMAVHGPNGTVAHQFKFPYDRGRNIECSALNALNMLRKVLLSDLGIGSISEQSTVAKKNRNQTEL